MNDRALLKRQIYESFKPGNVGKESKRKFCTNCKRYILLKVNFLRAMTICLKMFYSQLFLIMRKSALYVKVII